MAKNNAVNTSLSGQTGTGAFVGADSPTIRAPVIRDLNNNLIQTFGTNSATADAYLIVENHNAINGVRLIVGSTAGTNVQMNFITKGTGTFVFQNGASNTAFPVRFLPNGAAGFEGRFTWGTLTGTRLYTFQDASGTLAFLSDISAANTLSSNGRLTLTSGVPVTTAPVLAAPTIFLTPFEGNRISLWTGSVWVTRIFPQISIAVPATTDTMYDIFVFDSAGTPTLELTAWTNDTTRAVAVVFQDGILVKSGDATRRLYGSFRTTGVAGQTEDSPAKRYLSNIYNKSLRPMSRVDTTDSWVYSTAAFRQANANTANQLDCVISFPSDQVSANVSGVTTSAGAGVNVSVGIGINSTTVNSAQVRVATGVVSGGNATQSLAVFNGFLNAGRNTLVWLEYGGGAGTQTWLGDAGLSVYQSGINGVVTA